MAGSQVVIILTIAIYLLAMCWWGCISAERAAAKAAMIFIWEAVKWAPW